MPQEHSLTDVLPGVHATGTDPLPFMDGVVVRSYVLERAEGPTLVYNSPGIARAAEEIQALGAPDRLLVNHWHEEMYGKPGLDVPVWVSAEDRSRTEGRLPVDQTFQGRQMLGEDLELIPTPGHTSGVTTFLWDSGEHRVLFTGDSLWFHRGHWEAVVLGESSPSDYADSLELMAGLDFDVVLPWVAFEDAPVVEPVEAEEAKSRIRQAAARVRAGERA